MDSVFEKTRELGQALLESDVYQKMKAAEDKAMKNEVAAALMGKYLELKQSLQGMMMEENADPVAMRETSKNMDEIQTQLQTLDEVAELSQAQADFNSLIGQVNQVLQFIVTGKISNGDDGCTGSCDSCGGHCHM